MSYAVGVVTAPIVVAIFRPVVRGAVKSSVWVSSTTKKVAAEARDEFRVRTGEANPGSAQLQQAGDIETIEGIDATSASRLRAAGVSWVETLLRQGGTRAGRKELADRTDIPADSILRWVNHADLRRVPRVGGQYAKLLEAVGVDSVPELARRNHENLAEALAEVNTERQLVSQVPTVDQVADWVSEAKKLQRVVYH